MEGSTNSNLSNDTHITQSGPFNTRIWQIVMQSTQGVVGILIIVANMFIVVSLIRMGGPETPFSSPMACAVGSCRYFSWIHIWCSNGYGFDSSKQ